MISTSTRFRNSLEISRQLKLAKDIERGQIQISGGKRLLAPSDDPVAAARISQIGRDQGNESAFKSNVTTAAALAARADTTLASVASLVDRAKELMLTGANGTLSAENRASIAIELRSIVDEIDSLSNAKDFRGQPLFSSDDPLEIPVAPGLTVAPVDSKANVFGLVQTSFGPYPITALVDAAAQYLEITDDAQRQMLCERQIGLLDNVISHVANVRGEQGLRAQRLDELTERYEDSAIKLTEERSDLESTDVAEAIARIQATQITLQAAQSIYAQLNQKTLFDLLR